MRCQGFVPRDFLEVAKGEVWHNSQYYGDWRVNVSRQSQPDIVLARPFYVLRNGHDHALGHIRIREYLQYLAFCKKSIAERQFDRLRMTLRQNGPGNPRWSPSRQCQFLSHRKMRDARENNSLGRAPNIRRRRREQGHMHQIEEAQLSQECERDAPRSVWVARKPKSPWLARGPFPCIGNG